MSVASFIARRYFLGFGTISAPAIIALVLIPTPFDLIIGATALWAMTRNHRLHGLLTWGVTGMAAVLALVFLFAPPLVPWFLGVFAIAIVVQNRQSRLLLLAIAAAMGGIGLLAGPLPLIVIAAAGAGSGVGARGHGNRVSLVTIISMISLLGIKVGVGALICVLSVFNGFNGIVKGLFLGFDPHLRVTPVATTTLAPDSLLPVIGRDPDVVAAAPFVSGRSAIMHSQGTRVVQIRGMRKQDISTAVGLGTKIHNGSFADPSAERPHPIVLGAMLAFALNVSLGDTIALLSQNGIEESLTQLAQPNMVQCVVTGTFESNNKEYDENYAYTDIATAREIFAVADGAMGIEIRLSQFDDAPAVQQRMRQVLGPRYRVESWQDLHRDLLTVMELERWAAFIILSLIIIVAVFNVLGSLTMTVIEKRRDIGILKTMGAGDATVMRTYLYEGAIVGVVGTIGGVVAGLLVCWMQAEFGLFKLNSGVYIIPALPVDVHVADIAIVAATSLVLALTAALYPAMRASRLLPADAVRWE